MQLLASQERVVFGLDVSLEMLKIAKAKGLSTTLGSAYSMPFQHDTFDAVISIHMGFGFCENQTQMKDMTVELHRVLRPNGVILLDTPHGRTKGASYTTEWRAGDSVIKAMSYGKCSEEIVGTLTGAGFDRLRMYGFYNTAAQFREDSRRIIVSAVKDKGRPPAEMSPTARRRAAS
jgi:ubiquinone/menaquinone biosynthesis C-methylase UbiE